MTLKVALVVVVKDLVFVLEEGRRQRMRRKAGVVARAEVTVLRELLQCPC
jgi:hypothetical protein